MLRALSLSLFALISVATAKPPAMEAYGNLPEIRDAAISDDGRKIAMSMVVNGEPRLAVYDLDGGAPKAVGTGDAQVRGVSFVGNDRVVLRASEATRQLGFGARLSIPAHSPSTWQD